VTSAAIREVGQEAAASAAVQRARRLLLAYQDRDGWWPDRAVAEVTLAAEGLLAADRLAIRTAATTSVAARQIRSAQRADGSWAGAEPGVTADLSASVLAYLALLLAGDPPDAYHMAAAAGWIRDAGGVDAVGVTARAWLAMFGLTAWASVPVPAPEVVSLSARATTDAGMQSPVTAVTLAVLGALRPTRTLPGLALTELQAIRRQTGAPPVVERAPGLARAARSAALRRCGRWLADWQLRPAADEQNRSGWPLPLVALHALGYPPSHPAHAAGVARLAKADGPPGWSGSPPPVALTALAIEALTASGLSADDGALLAAGSWLQGQQVPAAATGHAPRGGPRPRGWSFCPDGCSRPADTACVLTALGGIARQAGIGSPGPADAARWLAGTQGRDGSWAGSAAVTGYCVRALASDPVQQVPVVRAIRRGVIWLLRAQLPLGAWPDGYGGSDLLATAVALTALRVAGVLPGKPAVTGAVGWLLAEQNPDGGWHLGEIAGPRRPGGSDPVGTAQALTALLTVDGAARPGVDAAAEWLIRAQLPDGSWPSPQAAADRSVRCRPGGAGDPVAGILLPLRALGRYAAAVPQCRESSAEHGNLAERFQHPPRKAAHHHERPAVGVSFGSGCS
jgi:squalene-hopene/tetraprenyl-beta-curcumene cyclase